MKSNFNGHEIRAREPHQNVKRFKMSPHMLSYIKWPIQVAAFNAHGRWRWFILMLWTFCCSSKARISSSHQCDFIPIRPIVENLMWKCQPFDVFWKVSLLKSRSHHLYCTLLLLWLWSLCALESSVKSSRLQSR